MDRESIKEQLRSMSMTVMSITIGPQAKLFAEYRNNRLNTASAQTTKEVRMTQKDKKL